jgi:hypothetical protein
MLKITDQQVAAGLGSRWPTAYTSSETTCYREAEEKLTAVNRFTPGKLSANARMTPRALH